MIWKLKKSFWNTYFIEFILKIFKDFESISNFDERLIQNFVEISHIFSARLLRKQFQTHIYQQFHFNLFIGSFSFDKFQNRIFFFLSLFSLLMFLFMFVSFFFFCLSNRSLLRKEKQRSIGKSKISISFVVKLQSERNHFHFW